MKKLTSIVAAIALSTSTAFAGVATVSGGHGKVLVNAGEGFVALEGAADLKVGDQIMVGDESMATISFAECSLSLDKPTVFTVSEKVPCVAGQKAMIDGVMIEPAADVDAGPVAAAPFLPLPLLLIGGAAAIGGVLLVTGVLDDDDEATCATPPCAP